MMRGRLIWFVPVLIAVPCGCRSAPGDRPAVGKLPVTVSILPQAYFVQRIGGDRVDVQVLIGPGQSHHAYEPTAKQIARLSQSRLFFRLGMSYEDQLLKRIVGTVQGLEVVDTREGIALRAMTEDEGCLDSGHDHGGGEAQVAHEHAAVDGAASSPDPHIWLSPKLVKTQAGTICRALARLDPANAEEYERRFESFAADLDRVDAEIARALAPCRGQEFFVFHPAFGYFADAYGLKQVAAEIGGKEPGPKQLAALIDRARRSGVRLIFVQQQFATTSAEALAHAIGGAVVPLDPLAEDYLENLRHIAREIAKGLARQPTTNSTTPAQR